MLKRVFVFLLCALLAGCVAYQPGKYHGKKYNSFKKYSNSHNKHFRRR